jgi:iron complex transport system permease protein
LVRFRFRRHLGSGLGLLLLVLALSLGASVKLGLTGVTLRDLYEAVVAPTESKVHVVIRIIRLPRALIAAGVGASLGVAGALMQALTRNPLASPSILGVNAGSALAVVCALFLLKGAALPTYAWFAWLGAAVAGVTVYALGSLGHGGATPLNLTVAGAAVSAFLSAVTQGILVLNQRTMDEVRFWMAGSVAGRDLALFLHVLPAMAVALGGSFVMGKAVTTLSLGEDVAQGLGQRTGLVKLAAAVLVVLLAGSAVAVAGPIAFVGLAVPHIGRALVGPDYRWILPYSAVLGAILLLWADIGARYILRPEEVPVGVMTALLGAPFFIYLARWGVKRA